MEIGTIKKVGFRKYALWFTDIDAMHFKGKRNVIQARELLRNLEIIN